MKYEIIIAANIRVLEYDVTDKLGLGWKLQGGVSTFMSVDNICFMQAMVKDNE